jgi:O-antigen ligase
MQTLTNSMERELKSDSSLRMERVNIWHEAYSTVQDHLLLGNGIGDADNLLLERFQKGNYPEYFYQFDCHNQYLEYVLIGGVFTLFVFLIILCYPLLYAVICKDYLFIAFIVMMMVHFCVETMLTIAQGIMFFAFFLNLLWLRLEQFNSGDYIVLKFKEKAYVRILLSNIIRIK